MIEPRPNVAKTTASAIATTPADVPQRGMPSYVSNMCMGIVSGTSINQTNNMLVHSCDFVNELNQSILLKDYLKALAKPIREAIRAIKKFLGLGDPTGSFSTTINLLSKIAQELRRIQREILYPIILFEEFYEIPRSIAFSFFADYWRQKVSDWFLTAFFHKLLFF
jgi:hypothetical protein